LNVIYDRSFLDVILYTRYFGLENEYKEQLRYVKDTLLNDERIRSSVKKIIYLTISYKLKRDILEQNKNVINFIYNKILSEIQNL